MKNGKTRISANEINRFVYCPYQWYYKRYYGTSELQEKYKALDVKHSRHESHFVKGLKHHKRYYLKYRLKKCLQILILIGIVVGLIGMVMKWMV